MNENLKITHKLTVVFGENNSDALLLNIDRNISASHSIATLTGNGESATAYFQGKEADGVNTMARLTVEELLVRFDNLNVYANTIDGDVLVAEILEKIKDLPVDDETKEGYSNRARNLVVVNSITGLFAVGNDLMAAVYGPNWAVESIGSLIKKSKRWNQFVQRVILAHEALLRNLPA